MSRWESISLLLILAVVSTTAETLKKSAEIIQITNGEVETGTGKLDYETALRPALLQKRSIANIARLLLGGNVPPNHPLVKYPEPKTWNLANNLVGSSLATSASSLSGGWAPNPGSAMANIQQLFETKAKLIPYTGQVVQGITGLTSVKGDLLRQIHTISTQAIAQAAAEAAARALASAAAAHAVTNSIAHAPNSHGAQSGIKGGWSSYQNMYSNPPYDKTPGDMPGPPYPSSSAHINHYQLPPPPPQIQPQPQYNSNPYQTTPQPQPQLSPLAYSNQPQAYQSNGYYTLYNTQPQQPQTSSSVHHQHQTQYTSAPPAGHARPTLSPSTLIATTPSGYSPSLSKPLVPNLNLNNDSLVNDVNNKSSNNNYLRSFDVHPVTVVTFSSSNNTPLPSFRRTVPAGIFGRNAAQPSATSSLLSTISSLLSASTAAYNAAFTGTPPSFHQPPQHPHHLQHHHLQHQHPNLHSSHQSPVQPVFSNLLSSASSQIPSAPPVLSHPTPLASPSTASVLSSGISSAANVYSNNGYQQQSTNSIPQGGGHYGSPNSGRNAGYLYNQPSSTSGQYFGATETRPTAVNAPGYTFNPNVGGNAGANYAQSGANSYIAHAIQSSPQFASGYGTIPAAAASTGSATTLQPSVPGAGYGAASFSSAGGSGTGTGFNGQVPGSGYPGYNGNSGSSHGHVGGWNTQHAGSSPSASTWSGPSPIGNPSGYPGQASGNVNNPSGGFGRAPPAQFPVAAGSSPVQQAYPTFSQNAYQSPAPNVNAQAQAPPSTQAYPQYQNQQQYQAPQSNTNGVGGLRNSNLNYNNNNNYNYNPNHNNNYQRHDSHDQNQSASTMGNDYEDNDYDDEDHHHSYQQAQRRNRPNNNNNYKNTYSSSSSSSSSSNVSKYPSPSKKRPFLPKRPSSTSSSSSSSSFKNSNSNYRGDLRTNGSKDKNKHNLPTGSKKGPNFDSSVDVVDVNYVRQVGDEFSYSDGNSEENGNNDKNRWRSKNPSGQRTHTLHNHNTHGRWNGEAPYTKQAPSKNVRGNVEGSERTRSQSGQSTGKSQRNKNGASKQRPHTSYGKPKSKTEANIYSKAKSASTSGGGGGGGRGRLSNKQQWKQQPTEYKSRDVYTTLPEFVFRVGERTDVFLRPDGQRKHRNRVRGRLSPRFGETTGSSGGGSSASEVSEVSEGSLTSSSSATSTKEEDMEVASTSYIEALSKELYAEYSGKNVEKSTDSKRSFFSPTAVRGEKEKFIIPSSKTHETSRRADILSDLYLNNDSGFITASEEFDPEEREAFVDDVYADDLNNKRRHDYLDEQASSQTSEDYNNSQDDIIDT